MAVVSDDPTATSATLYVGKPGQAPVITKTIVLTLGSGTIVLEGDDTRVPLDTYKYQLNISHPDSTTPEKYPDPESCGEDGLPEFIVVEALDETEVVS